MINFNYFIKHVKGRKDLPHTEPVIANRIFYVTFCLKIGFKMGEIGKKYFGKDRFFCSEIDLFRKTVDMIDFYF